MAQFFALTLEDVPPVRSSGAGDSLDGEGKTVAGWHGEAKMEVGVVGSDEEEEASCLAQVRKRGRNSWLSNTVFVPDLVSTTSASRPWSNIANVPRSANV